MGGGIFIQPFLSGRKCNTVRYTKGNVTIADKVKTCEQKYRYEYNKLKTQLSMKHVSQVSFFGVSRGYANQYEICTCM